MIPDKEGITVQNSAPMPVYQRLPNDDETLRAIELVERAIRERRVVKVWFFKELHDERGRTRWFTDSLDRLFGRRKMLRDAPSFRVVEPLEWDTNADGRPYMRAIVHNAPREERPVVRTIRLDRVAVSSRRGLRLVVTRRPYVVEGTGLDPQRAPSKVPAPV